MDYAAEIERHAAEHAHRMDRLVDELHEIRQRTAASARAADRRGAAAHRPPRNAQPSGPCPPGGPSAQADTISMTPQAAQSNSLDPVPTIPPAAPENMPARQHHAESAGPLATEETARVEASRVADEARRRAELRAAVVRSAAARRAGETVEPTDPEEPYYRPRWS